MTDTPSGERGHLRAEVNLWFDETFDDRFPTGMRIASFPRLSVDKAIADLDDEEEMQRFCAQVKDMFDQSTMAFLKQIWAKFEVMRAENQDALWPSTDDEDAFGRLDALLATLGLEDPYRADRGLPLKEIWSHGEAAS